jgi:drug/metabolite transporter (DMT)-like permease
MTRDRAVLLAVLVLIGAAWGITQPFAKIAVSEGYRHFGIIFWQFALGALLLAAINRARGRACRWARGTWRFMSSSR